MSTGREYIPQQRDKLQVHQLSFVNLRTPTVESVLLILSLRTRTGFYVTNSDRITLERLWTDEVWVSVRQRVQIVWHHCHRQDINKSQ